MLLDVLQPAALDRSRSTALFRHTPGGTSAQARLVHASDPTGNIELSYLRPNHTSPIAALLHDVAGLTEYYGDNGRLERALLTDLADLLLRTYAISDTYWRSHLFRTTTRRLDAGHCRPAVHEWLAPPRWLIPKSHLHNRRRILSFERRPLHAPVPTGLRPTEQTMPSVNRRPWSITSSTKGAR